MSLHHISKREKLVVMLAVMSALLLVALDQTIVSTAVAAIAKQFNSFSSIGFVFTAYMLTTTITTPLAGKLSDMYGRRLLLLIGVSVFTIGSWMSGHSPTIDMLILWRAVQGIGGGIISANAFTIIGDLFTPRERGRWQGLFGAVFGLSSVAGPLIGGWLTDGAHIFGAVTDWRWTFFVNVPVGIIAFAIIAKYCPPIKHDAKHYPDYIGATFITIALAAVVLAVDNTDIVFSSLINHGVTLASIKAALFTIAALATGIFILVERRAKQPIVPLWFYKNRTFVLVTSAMLLFGAAFMGAILYLTQFNQQVFGASASTAGVMLLPFVGGMMVTSIMSGQIASRTGRYKLMMVSGIAIAAIAIFSLTMLEPTTPFWQEAVRMVFVGLGMGMVMPLMNLAVQNEFEQKDLGAATATVQLTRGLGSTLGTAILSGALTAGIIASLGNPNDIPYIHQLKQTPQASALFGKSDITADTLLAINSQKQAIKDGAAQAINATPAPAPVKKAQLAAIDTMQTNYNHDVVYAFANGLHEIFLIAASLMGVAFVLTLFVKERQLRSGVNATPGE